MKNNTLITQSGKITVTVRSDKVPVIETSRGDLTSEAVMAVNFLRAGCPDVQFVVQNGPDAISKRNSLARMLLMLQLSDELFWLFGKPLNKHGGYTVLILCDKKSKK